VSAIFIYRNLLYLQEPTLFTGTKFLSRQIYSTLQRQVKMISTGLILLIVGLIAGIAILQSLGLILIIVGVVLAILGGMGRAVGGRSHYW